MLQMIIMWNRWRRERFMQKAKKELTRKSNYYCLKNLEAIEGYMNPPIN